MKPPHLELQIDELVIHGLPHLDRAQLGAIIQRELSRLFAEQGVPGSLQQPGAIAALNGGSFTVQPDAPLEAVGGQIARAMYGGFGQ